MQEGKYETTDRIYFVLDSNRHGTYDVSAQSVTGIDYHISAFIIRI